MDYEQKYKEALEKATKLHSETEYVCEMEMLEQIFPELKESDDEKMLDSTIEDCKKYLALSPKQIAWLEKQKERKPIESEEDEKMLKRVIDSMVTYQAYAIVNNNKEVEKMAEEEINWLKSFKPQPKQEYQDDDTKEMFIKAIERAQELKEKGYTLDDCDKQTWYKDFVFYSKIHPLPHWKPSKEQMNALDKAKNNPSNYYDIRLRLQSLYNDLLKF